MTEEKIRKDIKAYLKWRNISMRRFAEETDVSICSLSRFMSGKYCITVETLFKMWPALYGKDQEPLLVPFRKVGHNSK